ncbi:MAG TPA: hypothetical protein VFK13_07115 [Gemmatimonadaceae bacterium]|nr:hypothetical protein [Gemmatimonadaceae bacterium]
MAATALFWLGWEPARRALERVPGGDVVLMLYLLASVGCILRAGHDVLLFLLQSINARDELGRLRRQDAVVAAMTSAERERFFALRRLSDALELDQDEFARRYPNDARLGNALAEALEEMTPEEVQRFVARSCRETEALRQSVERDLTRLSRRQ